MRTSSKDKGKEQEAADRSRSKRPKHKDDSGKEKTTNEGAGKKKKRRLKKAQDAEGDTEREKEVEAVEAELTKKLADQDQITGQKKEGPTNTSHIKISEEHDTRPPRQPLPFMPIPRVGDGHITVKENDRGIGHPQITSTLMDSIVLPADVTEYLKYSE